MRTVYQILQRTAPCEEDAVQEPYVHAYHAERAQHVGYKRGAIAENLIHPVVKPAYEQDAEKYKQRGDYDLGRRYETRIHQNHGLPHNRYGDHGEDYRQAGDAGIFVRKAVENTQFADDYTREGRYKGG